MEAMLRNVASTVELLAVAPLTAAVSRWDERTLTRAFHWAKYCEHIHSRFHTSATIRRAIEQQLDITNHSLQHAVPHFCPVCFSDLPRFQHMLLIGLLNNPNLPSTIIKVLFDSKSPGNDQKSDYEDVTGFCSSLIQCKSACKVLRPLCDFAVGADAEVQGELLIQRLAAVLSQGSHPRQAERFLTSTLQVFEGAAQHSCLVIAAALLTVKVSALEPAAQEFLLEWLQSQPSVLQHMCSTLPSVLLKDLAKEHRQFGDALCSVLKKMASEMEFDMEDSEWVCTRTDSAVSFQRLAELFLQLFEACPTLRSKTEDQLTARKVSDGDFDVRGLSVWGDLLLELNKCKKKKVNKVYL